jgi:hypothetical protein
MCATVCPSQALFFGTREEVERLRPQSEPVNRFRFGAQEITTRVFVMAPRRPQAPALLDVTSAMEAVPHPRPPGLVVLQPRPAAVPGPALVADPFAGVEV